MNDSVIHEPLETLFEIACTRPGAKDSVDELFVFLCKLAGKGFPNQPHALDNAGGCMFAKIGFVSLDDLLLKPSGFDEVACLGESGDNFGHTADNKVFLEQVLELFGNVCQKVHVCGKDGVGERVAVDGANELGKPHGTHGELVDFADGK